MAPKVKNTKLSPDNFKSKQEAVKAALEKVKKDHGAEAAMLFSDKPVKAIEKVSTGSMGLDVALGIGGYARGRIIEIYGLESSGKCLTADTYVWTTDGFVTISEMFERNGMLATCITRTTERQDQLYNRHGVPEDTTHFTHNGRKPVFEVLLADGSSVKSTHNHPHLVMNSRGSWVWRKTGELTAGDVVVKARGVAGYSVNPSISEETAYALGALVADGCFTSATRISFTNNDPHVVSVVLSFMAREGFSVRTYPRPENNTTEYHFNDKERIAEFMQKYGLHHGAARDKRLPYCVRTGGTFSITSFLQGYIDCEAWLDTEGTRIEVVSASRKLLDDVQQALLYCGVFSYVREKTVAGREEDYWTLNISGPSITDYLENIGFQSTVRNEEAAHFAPSGKSTMDVVPNIAGLLQDLYEASETTREHSKAVVDYGTLGGHCPTLAQLDKILELNWAPCAALTRLREIQNTNYVYVPVISVRLVGEEPTFDFAMSETHSFIANGVVTHNTTLSLHAIAEVQARGGTAAFIDAEHALDPTYASNLGVDMDNVVISQPDNGEQALSIAETLVTSGGFDIVVVDSVAALVPQAEIDGEMGDHHVGTQARLMSQALRKLAGLVHKSNTILIFINQVRMKIGVMFGNPETTTGGNALKFYASQRLEVRRIGEIKEGEDRIGNRTKVKVVKNKLAPPFREVEFDIKFGKGVDYYGELVDIGAALGLIEKAGAWYSYLGERIGQGRNNAVAYLEAHPDAAETLDSAIRKHYRMDGAADDVPTGST